MEDMALAALWKNAHGALRRVFSFGPRRRRAGVRRGAAPAALLACKLALLVVAALPAAAERAEGPRVVWAAGAQLYVAAPDSGLLAPHVRVRVVDRDREVARGEVTRVLDGRVASVALEAPLDERVRLDRLERLDVTLEPAPVRAIAALRIGIPAPSRRGLVPPCADGWLDKSALPRAYLDEPLGNDAVRLVADTTAGPVPLAATSLAWPDTLVVRFYADRADEEIALERGELDVGVFWPGEPSARLRDRASGFELLLGLRARGALVATGVPEGPAARARVAGDLAALDAELFAGDLLTVAAAGDSNAVAPSARVRWSVDPALPGARTLERLLGRGAAAPNAALVRLAWRDGPPQEGGEAAPPGLLVRCPVIGSPERAADVRALGVDRFANLPGCRTEGLAR